MAHLAFFWGSGVFRAIGLAIVIQNMLGSLFNSHLSTVTQGMLYCLGVGLIGSLVWSARRQASCSVRGADSSVRTSPGAASA